ncbi:hypothetical protein CLAFUW4_05646 [Fulvia fulva]|nr:hypothetical protein CLAFUR4_05641 [Fulvia fulva]WPV14475.1 hypothetical protein CLAFUW4_05646 [Fulvia fulva]WPV29784.1 hypothetical protein CLAFUW7_05645 [Fulvia fulva]
MAQPMAALHSDHSAHIAGFTAIAIALVFWSLYRYWVTPDLRRIPLVGKKPGYFGFDLTAVKKDFAKNGRKILYDGYIKASHICGL